MIKSLLLLLPGIMVRISQILKRLRTNDEVETPGKVNIVQYCHNLVQPNLELTRVVL